MAPWLDVCYFADAKWWKWHSDKPEFKVFAGEKCTIFNTGNAVEDPAVFMLRPSEQREGLSTDPQALVTGSNGGHQVVNIATLAGAARIVLLGFDAKPGAHGKKHWFGDHPDRTEAPYDTMITGFRKAAPLLKERGVEVLNASPGSAIDCFRRVNIEDVFACAPTA